MTTPLNWGIRYASDANGGGGASEEDDYLSRLAKSVLGKEKSPAAAPQSARPVSAPPIAPPSAGRVAADPKTPAYGAPERESRESRLSATLIATPTPTHRSSSAEISPSIRRAVSTGSASEWNREVDFHDETGALIPGTILVLEDGSMGVFRERNPVKEYDIVYMLKPNGRAIPQGMPLANYDVEPIGRLTHGCMDLLASTGKWERDMIVFHLLKFQDRVHIPEITAEVKEGQIPGILQDASVSSWTIKKPDAADLQAPPEEKPALTRGRNFTIMFGPQQRWGAVYWGKDELGHVVAHKTHDKWTIMHLDLNRFKDTLQFGDIVPPGTITEMERDFVQK